MRVSESISPALRRALAARVRLPEGGVGVDNIGRGSASGCMHAQWRERQAFCRMAGMRKPNGDVRKDSSM